MLNSQSDTIAAIATPMGEGGLSVVRLSGPNAIVVAAKLFRGRRELGLASSHTAHVGLFTDDHEDVLDEVVCTVFRHPSSYTGEDVVEVSCHGGILVTKRILHALLHSGARQAEPGEFTKRAFLNGRMDLSQAEAVADLIRARSDIAHRASFRQLKGTLSRVIKELRSELVESAGLLELELDFAEEKLEFVEGPRILSQIETSIATIEKLLSSYNSGRAYREGVKVVIAGTPNVGKSSLLNALLDEDRAIVTDTPGTTRDVIEEAFTLNGLMFRVVDTAGLRQTDDPVEKEGMRRTEDQVADANIVLLLIDNSRKLEAQDIALARNVTKLIENGNGLCLLVVNKIDLKSGLNGDLGDPGGAQEALKGLKTVKISALSGEGLSELKEALVKATLGGASISEEGSVTVTNARHYGALLRARTSLLTAAESLRTRKSNEFVAMDLRSGLDSLGEIIGEVTNEDILNQIFAKFCIGK